MLRCCWRAPLVLTRAQEQHGQRGSLSRPVPMPGRGHVPVPMNSMGSPAAPTLAAYHRRALAQALGSVRPPQNWSTAYLRRGGRAGLVSALACVGVAASSLRTCRWACSHSDATQQSAVSTAWSWSRSHQQYHANKPYLWWPPTSL